MTTLERDSTYRETEHANERRRSLALDASPNFRDAGGYRTQSGEPVAWGRIFRSGHLANLSGADRARLAALDLDLVCDFRRPDEQQREPSELPQGVSLLNAPVTPGSQGKTIYANLNQRDKESSEGAMFDFMCAINREFVVSQHESFRQVFVRLLASGAERVLFHCSAGKDRTGFAIAMLHMALGVSERDVESDYLLTSRYYIPEQHISYIRSKYPVDHLDDTALLPMLRADIAYLRSAFKSIDSRFASRDVFLESALGLGVEEREELRRRFLQRA